MSMVNSAAFEGFIGPVELFDKWEWLGLVFPTASFAPPSLLALRDLKNFADALPSPVLFPIVVIGTNRRPIRKPCRQTPPTTGGLEKIEDRVDYFPHVQLPRSSDGFLGRHQVGDLPPLVVG
jgi:hypothetical protein